MLVYEQLCKCTECKLAKNVFDLQHPANVGGCRQFTESKEA